MLRDATASTRCTAARWARASSTPRATRSTAPGVTRLPGPDHHAPTCARYRALTPGADPRAVPRASTSTACRCRPPAASPSASRSTCSRPTTSGPARALSATSTQVAVPAPLRRGHRDRVRRPQPLGRRRARRADRASCCRRSSRTSGPASCSTPAGRTAPADPVRRPRTATTSTARPPAARAACAPDDHGTTHLTVTDRWGNVAAYTLTIEQTGGSGITVPGYGFLLNNELTDFNFAPLHGRRARPEPARPGQAPALVDEPDDRAGRRPPGAGARLARAARRSSPPCTQVLTGHLDRDLRLVDAIAAPRLSSRNGADQPGRTGDLRRPGRRRAPGSRPRADRHTRRSAPRRRSGSCRTAGSRPRPRPPAAVAAPPASSSRPVRDSVRSPHRSTDRAAGCRRSR